MADRWHLLKNLRETVERLFARSYGTIRRSLAPAPPSIPSQNTRSPAASSDPASGASPPPVSRRRQAQQLRRAQRVERFERVRQLHRDGQSIHQIAVSVDLDGETVRRYSMDQCPAWQPSRSRPAALDGFRAFIDQRLREGHRNATELHRELTNQGHCVSYFAVQRFVRRRLASLGMPRPKDRLPQRRPRLPSARQLAFTLIRRHEGRSAQEQGQLEAIRQMDEELREALQLAEGFAAMIRKTSPQTLSAWLTEAEQSRCVELRGFARRLRQDEGAVAAALDTKWSNGPVEGHVNRLKVIKRQMYGRAGFQLLRVRVLNAA